MWSEAKAAAKPYVPAPIWKAGKTAVAAMEQARRKYFLGELGRGAEATVVRMRGGVAEKRYALLWYQFNEEFGRHLEWEMLETAAGPHVVRMYGHNDASLRMELLGNPLGTFRGISHVQNRRALNDFLSEIVLELEQRRILHRDLHPGNILYDPKNRSYKL